MRDEKRFAADLDQLLGNFSSIATHRVCASGYCPRLPDQKVEALAAYLEQDGDIQDAAVLRTELQSIRNSLFGPFPWGNNLDDRQQRFETAVDQIVLLLKRVKGRIAADQEKPSDPESLPDGPVKPDGFAWQGMIHCGLAPKPFSAVAYLWEEPHRTATQDDLADPVYGDREECVPDNAIGGLRREINKFFREKDIPLHAEQHGRSLTLRVGSARPKRKPKSKATRRPR